MVSCGGNPIIPPVEEEVNIHITDMFWVPDDKVIEITLNQFPSTWGDWTMYINGEKLSMEEGTGKPVVAPNADLDEPPTGLYVGTLPWLGPITEVDFPCCGTIQFDIPGEGLTNEYEFNLINFGCETASEEECSQTPPNEDNVDQEIEQEFQDNQEMITHHLEEIAEPGKTPEQYAQELAALLTNESQVSKVEVFENSVNLTYASGKIHFIRFTDKEEGDEGYLLGGGNSHSSSALRDLLFEERDEVLFRGLSYQPSDKSLAIPLKEQPAGIQDFNKCNQFLERSSQEKLLQNRKILVWSPLPTYAEILKANLAYHLGEGENLGFTIEIIKGCNATVNSLKEITNYGMVFLFAHGAKPNGDAIITGEEITEDNEDRLGEDDIYFNSEKEIISNPPYIIEKPSHFAVSYDWVSKNIPKNENNKIVIGGMCYCGNINFWNAFKNIGAGDYFGWDGSVFSACIINRSGNLLSELKSGVSNTEDAYEPYGCNLGGGIWKRFGYPVRFASDDNLNHPPIISNLTANPSSVDINQTTTITCIASDPDENPLAYNWTVNAGSFEGSTSGPSVTWRAPSSTDIYIVVGCEVSDGEGGEDSESINIIVTEPDVNHAPVITSIPVTSTTKGQPYSYDVNATDSDGDTRTYSLTTKPSGMTINSSTGLINWTPAVTGDFNVTVKVSDNGSPILSDTQSFTITVEENGTYTITASAGSHGSISPSGSITVNQGSDKSFTITPDNDYSINDVLVDGSSVGAVSSYTFTNVTQDHTISATFIMEENGTYDLRDIGPAGGWIFYDKGYYSSGWRYLEAAPASTEWTYKEWGGNGTLIGVTETGIGIGQSNTTKIVTWLNSHSETGKAAQLCDALVYSGYSNWFLPSRNELNLMYENLYVFGVGGFESGDYWSSSEYLAKFSLSQRFSSYDWDGGMYLAARKLDTLLVRAVRAF